MTTLVLVVLAVMWIAVLLPPYLRGRAQGRPSDSISSFQRQLSVLERSHPVGADGRVTSGSAAGPAGRMTLAQAQARRRAVVTLLGAAAALTFVVGVLETSMRQLLLVHLLLDGLLVTYLAMLLRARGEAAEREMKVRFLPAAAPSPAVRQLAVARRAAAGR